MTWAEHNIETIKKLQDLGVDTGLAEKIIKSDINRNFTLDAELTACEVLTASYNPKENRIAILFSEDNEKNEIDIKINEKIFEVKRFVIPNVQAIILDMVGWYKNTVMKENCFVQVIVTLDKRTGLDTIKEGDIKIHETDGITGVEIVIDLKMFKDLIAKKILDTFDDIDKGKIPIIDVRYFEVADFDSIKSTIHKHYSKRGYFLLLLTYTMDEKSNLMPYFYPIYHPEEKYKDILRELSYSITTAPLIYPYLYSYEHKINLKNGCNNLLQRDGEGYIVIDGKRICKSLTFGKQVFFWGGVGTKNVSKISLVKNGEEKQIDVEYLKSTQRKK